jgi:mutator protein MutT
MRQVTLCLLIKNNQVLLAMKKRGFGEGWWNGTGGKVKKDESLEEAAIRETKEEISVTPTKMTKVAIIDFYFQDTEDWNQQMIVYLVTDWIGEPKESEEMKPQWFNKNQLPLEKMWPADKIWMPMVLSGKKLKGQVTFNKNKELVDYSFQ